MSYFIALLISITMFFTVIIVIQAYRKKHTKLTGWQQLLLHEEEIKRKKRQAL
ncbi:hypothetical protein [Candidatus Regiella insecticola]|uniref:hypothetical protein n=1 Tax=Candidatus Regiella insecticola TaxID=138073 RepID=UPI00159D548E|nr:hypothetical protein [Candidatus Regiella insecticola]